MDSLETCLDVLSLLDKRREDLEELAELSIVAVGTGIKELRMLGECDGDNRSSLFLADMIEIKLFQLVDDIWK